MSEFFTMVTMYLFLQKIDYTSIKEDTNFTIKSDFEKNFRSQYAIEAARYPFLSKSQIKNRTMTIMKKKNISLPRYVLIAI